MTHIMVAVKPGYGRRAARSLSPDKSAPAGDGDESNTRKDVLQAQLPSPALRSRKGSSSFSHNLLVLGGPEKTHSSPLQRIRRNGAGTISN
jgi:hypothetical protein